MNKENTNTPYAYHIDPFTKWAHKTGRIFIFSFIAYSVLVPLIMCLVYHCFPSFDYILPGFVSIFAMMAPTSIFEVGIYVPMLGSSSYLTFATGNLINLKIPCVINAQKVASVEQNTTAGDAVSLIATCVSSIVTIVILTLGLFLAIPLKGVLESPTVSTASNYLLPSLFGCICLSFLMPGGGKTIVKNRLLSAAIPAVLVAIVSITGILSESMAMLMLIVVIPLCILFARIFYKKGIIKVIPNPLYAKKAAAEAEKTESVEA